MKSSIITAASLLAVAIAQPHRGHQKLHEKRDVVWVTETDLVWETIDITTTVWVYGSSTPTPAVVATTSSVNEAAQFYQTAQSSSTPSGTIEVESTPAPTSTPETTPTPSTLSSVYVAPVVSVSASASSVAEVSVESSSIDVAPSVAEPSTTSTPEAATIPATSTATPEAATTTTSSSSAATTCTKDSPCTGDMTYYDAGAGIGACGWTVDGSTENVIALPADIMGAQSNGNPYCGAMVTISYNGKTATAKVVDKCPGCAGASIDLSNHVFDLLADEAAGRVTCDWWFN